MSALKRVKAWALPPHTAATVNYHDIEKLISVVEAADWYMDDPSKQTVSYLRKALEALAKDNL